MPHKATMKSDFMINGFIAASDTFTASELAKLDMARLRWPDCPSHLLANHDDHECRKFHPATDLQEKYSRDIRAFLKVLVNCRIIFSGRFTYADKSDGA